MGKFLAAALATAAAANATPASAEISPEQIDAMAFNPQPMAGLVYENPDNSRNKQEVFASFSQQTGNWALTGVNTQSEEAKAHISARSSEEIPPEEMKAWGCKSSALETAGGGNISASVGSPAQRIKRFPVKGRGNLLFFISVDAVRFSTLTENGVTDDNCDSSGNRDLDVRVVEGITPPAHGKKKRRNSKWVSIINDSNEGIPAIPGKERYVKVPLFRPYECKPGRGKRNFWVEARVRPNYSPLPPEASNLPDQKTYRSKLSGINRTFKPC